VKVTPCWQLCVLTAREAEESVTHLLSETYGPAVSSYTDIETGLTTVTAWLTAKPRALPRQKAALTQSLRQIAACGLRTEPGTIKLARVRRQDWAESWKRHFPPLEIGRRLLVRPSWSRRRPRRGQALVVLDPGLSFGTGQHPTTEFCLEQLVKQRNPGAAQSCLDVGTGSGILAIAAAKLGYRPVVAFDFDPEAVRVARANARANGVAGGIALRQMDVAQLRTKGAPGYSIVCANLISSLLVRERKRLVAAVAPEGTLVLAGILAAEFQEVRASYEAIGFRLLASRTVREWRSGAFSRS
jgi:ribosomal protein L11 methyltransferase